MLLLLLTVGGTWFRPTFAILLTILLVSNPKRLVCRFFRWRVLREFGKYSYCIYLTHAFFLAVSHWILGFNGLAKFGTEWITEITLGMSMTFLVAFLSWRYFEKPLVDYGHKFKYEKTEASN